MEKIARVVGARIFDSVDIMPIAGNEASRASRRASRVEIAFNRHQFIIIA